MITGKLTNGALSRAQARILRKIGTCACGCAEIVSEELCGLLDDDREYERVKAREKRAKQDVQGTPLDCTTSSTIAPMGCLTTASMGAASANAPPPGAGAALAAAPPLKEKREKTICPMDWKPTQEDCESVIEDGIRGDEIAAITQDFVTRKRESGEESYCWSATFRRFCTFKIAKGYKAIYPAVRPRSRPRKKEVSGLAGGDSRAKVGKDSGTNPKAAPEAPQGTGPTFIRKDSPEHKAWEAYQGRKLPCSTQKDGDYWRQVASQWPPGDLAAWSRGGGST